MYPYIIYSGLRVHIKEDHEYIVNTEAWNMGLGRLVLGFPRVCLKGTRIMVFQLSSFYFVLYRYTELYKLSTFVFQGCMSRSICSGVLWAHYRYFKWGFLQSLWIWLLQ